MCGTCYILQCNTLNDVKVCAANSSTYNYSKLAICASTLIYPIGMFSHSGNSENANAVFEQIDFQLPGMDQVTRRIQDERLEVVRRDVHAHVVLGCFPVKAALPLPERGGDTADILLAWWVSGAIKCFLFFFFSSCQVL